MPDQIIFVAGSRVITRYMADAVAEFVEGLTERVTFLNGNAPQGVDPLLIELARKNGHKVKLYTPDYGRYGRAAPIVRNAHMAEACTHAVMFWDGESRGTWDAIHKVRKLGKPCDVRVFNGARAPRVVTDLIAPPTEGGDRRGVKQIALL